MSKNITYLLGAGASFHSIPIVSTMNERMLLFLNMLDNYRKHDHDRIKGNVEYGSLIKLPELYNNLDYTSFNKYKVVVNEAINHYTVDTYARKLWLQDNDQKLSLLKEFLCLYFAFEQSSISSKLLCGTPPDHKNVEPYIKYWDHIKRSLDYRYDVFMASLLDREMSLPPEVSIISWNYDYQLELAYMNFADCSIDEAIKKLSIYPGLNVQAHRAKIIKLNGSAMQMGYPDLNEDDRNLWTVSSTDEHDCYKVALNELFGRHKHIWDKSEHLINFAWEDRKYQKKAIKRAKEVINNTQELIVIGYSFPNFNKKIDAELFSGVTRAKYRIKVQCGINDYESIGENIRSLGGFIRNADIEFVKNIDQFYIPAYHLINS